MKVSTTSSSTASLAVPYTCRCAFCGATIHGEEKIIAEGTTMIMVTHNEEICRMADRVVRMRGGRMHEVTINRRKAHATDLVW